MNDLQRILFPFVGDTVGGSHLSALALIAALPDVGIEPRIVLHRRGALAELLAGRGIVHDLLEQLPPVAGGNLAGQVAGMARAAPASARYLRRTGIDLVHTNDARMHLTWAPAARLAGRPLVWHQRSADDSRRLAWFARPAAAVVTISEHCRRHVAPGLGRRARVIYDPFDTEAPPPDRAAARARLLAALGAPADAAVVGFVGNLTQQKRPLMFVEAAARLRRALRRPAVFPMIGEVRAELAETVRDAIAQASLGETCRLLGPRHPIEPWIAGFDVLAAPAVNEGLGRTLVEAALAGTPVVAADDGGHREAIEDGVSGRLVPRDDPAALAQAVLQHLADPAAGARLAAAARDRAVARFATARHVEAMLDVYRSVAR